MRGIDPLPIEYVAVHWAGRRIDALWHAHDVGHLTWREYADGYEHNKALCIAAIARCRQGRLQRATDAR